MLNFIFFIIFLSFIIFLCAVSIFSFGLNFHQRHVLVKADEPLRPVSLISNDPFVDPYHSDQSSYTAEKLNYNYAAADYSSPENYRITFVQYSTQPPLSMQQSPMLSQPQQLQQSPQMSISPNQQVQPLPPPSYTSPYPPQQSGQVSPQQSGSPPLLVPPSTITRMQSANSSVNLPTQNTSPAPSSSTPQFTGNPGTDLTPPETGITSVADGNNSTLMGAQGQQSGQVGNNNTTPSSTNRQSNTTATSHSTKIMFTFAGTDNVAIAGFECSLDRPLPSPDSASTALVSAFASNNVFSCSNQVVIGGLVPGTTHVFEVRAVDSSGIRDQSPARFEWRVVNNNTTPVSSSHNNTSINNTPRIMTATNSTFSGNRTINALQESQTFTAQLSGKDEVPPVNTQVTGKAQFQLLSDGKEIDYDLTATNLNGFMMAHIHQGKTGENGQPIAALQMGKGKITAPDLQGSLAGKQMSDMLDLMKNGDAYVNVHTQQNQNGEIRGQIMTG